MVVGMHMYLDEYRHIHLDSKSRLSTEVQVGTVYLPQLGNRRERLDVGKSMELCRNTWLPNLSECPNGI